MRRYVPWWVAVSLGIGLTGVFLWPTLLTFTTHLSSEEDGLLITYLINWVAQAFVSGQNIYQVPFFWPYQQTLAYSVPFFSTAVLSLPWYGITTNSILIHNLHLVLGNIMLWLGMYVLVWEITHSHRAAILSAVVMCFGFPHYEFLPHLHVWLIAGIPWASFFLVKFSRTQKPVYALGIFVSFLYQALNSPETGYFLLASLLPWVLVPAVRQAGWQHRWLGLWLAGVAVTVVGLFYLPYWQVAADFNYTRSLRDAAHFSYSLEQLVIPELVGIYLVLSGLWWSQRAPKPQDKAHHLTSLLPVAIIITLIGAVLMLGPVLKISGHTFKLGPLPIPLPYAVMYYLVPGFKALRASSRWIVVMGYGLALLAGLLSARSRLTNFTHGLLVVLVTATLWRLQVPTMPTFATPSGLPDRYQLLIPLLPADSVLIELPVYSGGMKPYQLEESRRLYYQTYHHIPLYNGVSGFIPPDREQEVLELWQKFPTPPLVARLKTQGVTHLLLHYDQYQQLSNDHYQYGGVDAPSAKYFQSHIDVRPELQKLDCTPEACLYTIK